MNEAFDGFILNVSPFKERQAALLVLTPQGKTTVFVANSQPKQSAMVAAVSRGAFSTFYFGERKGKRVFQEARLKFHPLQKLTSIQALMAYEVLIELAIKYIEEEDASRYYKPYVNAVETLSHQPLVALNEFYRFLVEQNGIPLTLDQCVRCHTKKAIYSLSLKEGGFLCKACAETLQEPHVPVDQLTFIRDFYRHGPRLGIHETALLRLLKMHHDHALFSFNIPLISFQNFLTLFHDIHL